MHLSFLTTGFACVGWALAAVQRVQTRQTSVQGQSNVPAYTFTMPVDHFDSSNSETYSNRYFVNDTFYQKGGPVIVYGYGEQTVADIMLAQLLTGAGGVASSPMKLAEELHGVAIVWEHRYYGESLPVALSEDGAPTNGAQGYEYLTIEQAMEDLVYFANNFNKTTLPDNTVIKSTQDLDPYNTPWLYLGGSYSGALAAWLRVRSPEIFYATWASSAPVETRYDGSIYYNPIYRTLPSNCSTDLTAVIQTLNNVVASGNETLINTFYGAVRTAVNVSSAFLGGDVTFGDISTYTPAFAGYVLGTSLILQFQQEGPLTTTQVFCDMMEQFDGQDYLDAIANGEGEASSLGPDLGLTPFNSRAYDEGLVAAYGGLDGYTVAVGAYYYALWRYLDQKLEPLLAQVSSFNKGDLASWVWQTTSQLGYFKGFNETTNQGMEMVMNVTDPTVAHDLDAAWTLPIRTSDVRSPNVTAGLQYGGWNMQPSNVMFTNGEIDPWKAFSVMSDEENAGAPKRAVVQTVPECNQAPDGTDVFGLIYPGMPHVQDMVSPLDGVGSPVGDGVELFIKAYNKWRPCFEKSRDDVRNGKNPDGSSESAAGRYIPSHGGMLALVGITMYFLSSVL